MSPRAVVVLAEGFEETEAVTIIDLLRRGAIEVIVAGLHSTTVRGAHSLTFIADASLSEIRDGFDAIVLPGGQPGTRNLLASDSLLKMLRTACDAGKLCAAICAAPTVLAKAGILEGKAATCYPGHEGQMNGAIPSTDNVAIASNVITSRSLGTAIAFSLALLEYLVGKEAAGAVAAQILWNT